MKTNKKVMLSLALLMVNSAAFASEDFKEKAKRAASNALSKVASSMPTVDGAKQAVANFASSSVDVVKAHPVAIGAIVVAGLIGRDAVKNAKDAVATGVFSAASAVYDRIPSNLFKRAAAVPAEDSTNVVVSNGKSIQDMIDDNSVNTRINPNGILFLNHCRLTSLKGLENIPNPELFTQIAIQNNELTEIPENVFRGFVNVKQIILNNNKIKSLPDYMFFNNSEFEVVYLIENSIESFGLSAFFGLNDEKLPKLREVHFFGNPLNSDIIHLSNICFPKMLTY